jgi:HEAT repeat protein
MFGSTALKIEHLKTNGAAMKTIRLAAVAAIMILASTMTAGFAKAQQSSGNVSDDDLKIMALDGLRGADASVAVPQLQKVLSGNGSDNLKRHALLILAHEDTPQAREAVASFARSQANPALQAEAIRQLGVSGNPDAMKTLSDIYAASTDPSIKKSILRAFMTSGDKQHLLGAAQSEKDSSVRIDAIRLLGAMGSRDALVQLYKNEASDGGKIQILRGLMTSESRDAISQIAMTEASVEVRKAAIRDMGSMGRGTQTGAELVSLYGKEKDPAVRKEILRALFVQEDAKDLVDVARKETDSDLKVYAVRQLSLMRTKEAQDYMMEILSK